MDNHNGYYNRRACQRCHAQKLSCRPETENKCLRCTKASTECIPRLPLRVRKSENVMKYSSRQANSVSDTSDTNDTTRSTPSTSAFTEIRTRSSSSSINARDGLSESRNGSVSIARACGPVELSSCVDLENSEHHKPTSMGSKSSSMVLRHDDVRSGCQ